MLQSPPFLLLLTFIFSSTFIFLLPSFVSGWPETFSPSESASQVAVIVSTFKQMLNYAVYRNKRTIEQRILEQEKQQPQQQQQNINNKVSEQDE